MPSHESPLTVLPAQDGFKVCLSGAFHTEVDWLETELHQLTTKKPKAVELDLAKMHFISSTGLAVLISFRNQLVQQGATLRIASIQSEVYDAFRHARLNQLFQVDESVIVPTAPPA